MKINFYNGFILSKKMLVNSIHLVFNKCSSYYLHLLIKRDQKNKKLMNLIFQKSESLELRIKLDMLKKELKDNLNTETCKLKALD
jgi:hypothetical protein